MTEHATEKAANLPMERDEPKRGKKERHGKSKKSKRGAVRRSLPQSVNCASAVWRGAFRRRPLCLWAAIVGAAGARNH